MRRFLRAVVLVLASAIVVAFTVPSIRWRGHVTILKASGQIPDVEWKYLIPYLSPASGQTKMAMLIDTHNPYAVILNPKTSPADIRAGAELFRTKCSSCHGLDAAGGLDAPALFSGELKHGASDWAVFRAIRNGIPNTTMAAHPLSDDQIWQLVAFIGSLNTHSEAGAVSSGPKASISPVSYEELKSIREPSNDWLMYSGSYSSTRHSVLDEIGPANINQLALRWIYQFPGSISGLVEVSPIVHEGIMFVTVPFAVMALDAANGKLLWRHDHRLPSDALGGEYGMQNRGVGILNDKIFVGTSDARLTALSVGTGVPLWQTAIADYKEGYYISGAPLVYRDLVVTGVSTKQNGGRGFIAAFDANTGKERWRFFTVPGPGQPGNDSWKGDSWRNGGGPTWLTGSYDPERDLLYWGVGNPKPDYDAAIRKGDNLYTNSVVVLRGSTGKLVWYFQFTPSDDHDWDANQIPVLADYETNPGFEMNLLWANRNGFYYMLDRLSGRFHTATPFVHQTWADGIDANGRPIPRASSSNSAEGIMVYPGNVGATNWWSPSFDSNLDRFFVPVLEQGMVFFPNNASDNKSFPTIYSWPKEKTGTLYTAVRALEASTGRLVWEYRREPRRDNPAIGGLLSTRSNLVFGGDQSTFFSLNSHTGQLLWSFETGGKIVAAPVTYVSNGEQYVTIAAGNNLLAFALQKFNNTAAAKAH